jgi:hypothetical protein
MGFVIGGGLFGGKDESFGGLNLNFGIVFSELNPSSWGLLTQLGLSDTSGAGAYYGGGINMGAWYSGSTSPSGDSGWVWSREYDANIGLGASVGGSLNFTPDTKDAYGSLSGSLGTRIGVGIGAQKSTGPAASRTWLWRPFEN